MDCHGASPGLSLCRAGDHGGARPPTRGPGGSHRSSARAYPAPVFPSVPMHASPPAPRLVAREAELATLHQWFAKALQGERQLGFITGEAGIGKTTLVDTFVAQLAGQDPLWLGHGQCIEQYGTGEAYLPLLEALGQMGRSPDGPHWWRCCTGRRRAGCSSCPRSWPQRVEALQRAPGGHTGAHAAGNRRGRGISHREPSLCPRTGGPTLE